MRTRLLVPLFLMLVWAAVSGSFSPANLIFGGLLGLIAFWLVREENPSGRIRPLRALALAGILIVELIKSGIRVAIMVLHPRMKLRPAILVYPLTVTRDFEITLLANLITLTPGTLTIDVSADRSRLYVHCVDLAPGEEAATIEGIRASFETRILKVFR